MTHKESVPDQTLVVPNNETSKAFVKVPSSEGTGTVHAGREFPPRSRTDEVLPIVRWSVSGSSRTPYPDLHPLSLRRIRRKQIK